MDKVKLWTFQTAITSFGFISIQFLFVKILVTGSAGFIGSALSLRLLERGDVVIGIDNHNNYYDPSLKEARLARHIGDPNYIHCRIDLADKQSIEDVFEEHKP